MTTHHRAPLREPTDTPSEVLSDATDLDALLEAILGDDVAPVAIQDRPREEITAPIVAVASRSKAVVVLPSSTRPDLEDAVPRGATADDTDAWGFVSEDVQARDEVADVSGADTESAPAVVMPALAPPTWRDKLPVSSSKPLLIVAALFAAALITAGAITLREQPTQTQTVPASDVPALVQSSPPVQTISAVTPTASPEVEVWAAAREPEAPSQVVSRTPPRRVNEATGTRTNQPTTAAFVETPRVAPPTASPAVATPAVVERIAEPTDRDAAPSRTAPTEAEPRRVVDAAPAAAATAPIVTNGAEPAPTPAAPPPAALPRRSEARLITGGAPEYPAALRTARIGGSVEVRFTIDASGRVTNVQSVAGPLQLRSAAEAAVRRWKYEAARVDNVAVETQTSVRFNFEPTPDRRPQQ